MSDNQQADIAAVLVHGTWAKKAEWIGEEGVFGQAIRACSPDAILESFRWTGINAHSARLEAGSKLAACVIEVSQKTPGRRICLIGHSHGGNVILYALRDSRVAEAVERVVFLGTPFLHIETRNISRVVGPPAVLFSWFLGLLMVITVVGIPLYVLYLWRWRAKVENCVREKFARTLQEGQERFLSRVQPPPASCPAFVCFVNGDEAGLVLSGVDKGVSLPWSIFYAIRAAAITTFLTFYTLLMTFSLLGLKEPPDDRIAPAVLLIPISLILVLSVPVVAAIWAKLLRGSPIGYGSEPLIEGATLRIFPRPTPDWKLNAGSRVVAWEAPPRLPGWRHSGFYNDEALAANVAQWYPSGGGRLV